MYASAYVWAKVLNYLEERLTRLKNRCGQIRGICCKGLAASVEFYDEKVFATVQKKAKEKGLIIGSGENNKLVFRPPYVITKEDIDAVVSVLEQILQSLSVSLPLVQVERQSLTKCL